MNIFYLNRDPIECALQHCDKHVVKMIIEYAQLMSTAHRVLDGELYFDKAKNGDIRCQAILDFTFEKLGQKMADFIHILNPQAIIFCGNIAKSMGAYMPIISGFCEAQLLNDFKGKIHYGVSELLDDRMNVLGPASLAFAKAEELVG